MDLLDLQRVALSSRTRMLTSLWGRGATESERKSQTASDARTLLNDLL